MSTALYHQQAEARAAEERRRLGLADDPVLDMRALVERQGTLVYSTAIPSGNLSGCFAVVAGESWMMINSLHSVGRQRFTTAHEFCHSLVHRDIGFITCTNDEKPIHEKYADAFAAAFLMPGDATRAFFSPDLDSGGVTPQRIVDYCYAFGVSYASAAYRLGNLRVVSAHRRTALLGESPMRIASAMGYDLQDPSSPFFRADVACPATEQLPRAYRSLALEAFDKELISESKLAELLGVEVDELDEILDPSDADEARVG